MKVGMKAHNSGVGTAAQAAPGEDPQEGRNQPRFPRQRHEFHTAQGPGRVHSERAGRPHRDARLRDSPQDLGTAADNPDAGGPRRAGIPTFAPSSVAQVIIISESSAQPVRPVRTGRSTPAHSYSSAVHNDTLRLADARPISVHTEVVAGILSPQTSPFVLRRMFLFTGPTSVLAYLPGIRSGASSGQLCSRTSVPPSA
jgi:hypothetical protein